MHAGIIPEDDTIFMKPSGRAAQTVTHMEETVMEDHRTQRKASILGTLV